MSYLKNNYQNSSLQHQNHHHHHLHYQHVGRNVNYYDLITINSQNSLNRIESDASKILKNETNFSILIL